MSKCCKKKQQEIIKKDNPDWVVDYFRNNHNDLYSSSYKYFVSSYESKIYNKFLSEVPDNSIIVDASIRDGSSLLTEENSYLIYRKRLQVFCYEKDEKFVQEVKKKIDDYKIGYNVFIFNKDIVNQDIIFSQKANYLYINGILGIINNFNEFITEAIKKFNPVNIIISNALEEKEYIVRSFMKPKLKYLTFGVDFGRVVTREELEKNIEECKLKIISKDISYHAHTLGIWADIWFYVLEQQKRIVRKF